MYFLKISSYEQYYKANRFIIVGAKGTFINSVMYKHKATDSVVYSFSFGLKRYSKGSISKDELNNNP